MSSYVYDTSGNLVVRRDPGKTTFFTGDEQLVLDTATNTVSGVRYYTLGGATVAVRNSAGAVQYLVADRQGTDSLVIDSNTEAVTRRQFLPFGQVRGSAPAWPGDRGYVGGTTDAATSLVNLGAREYNPANGRFVSADPVFTDSDPTQMGGYGYAGNNPATNSDPTGLYFCNFCDGRAHDGQDPSWYEPSVNSPEAQQQTDQRLASIGGREKESYSKPQEIEKKNSPRAASYASR